MRSKATKRLKQRIARSEGEADLHWAIRARKEFDRIALKIKTHRVIGRVVHNKSGRETEEGHDRRFAHDRARLHCVAQGRSRKAERDLQPSLGATGDAENDDGGGSGIRSQTIGVRFERRPPEGVPLRRGLALSHLDTIGSLGLSRHYPEKLSARRRSRQDLSRHESPHRRELGSAGLAAQLRRRLVRGYGS